MPPAPVALAADHSDQSLSDQRQWGWPEAVPLASGALFTLVTAVVVTTGHLGAFDGWGLREFAPVPRSGVVLSLVNAACLTASAAVGLVVLMTVGLALTYRRRSLLPLVTSTLAAGFLVASVYVLKWAVGRARPPLAAAVDPEPAFPSGHSTTAVVMTGVLLLLLSRGWPVLRRRIAWLAAGGYAVGIGVCRLYLGVHWFSDVLGGLLLGITIVALVSLLAAPCATRLDRLGSRIRAT